MSYRKPGVEIAQEQRSATPILPAPELDSCIIGHGYHWQDINWESDDNPDKDSILADRYTGEELIFNTSDINATYNDVVNDIVIVDLLGVKGSQTGERLHLKHGTDFTVAGNVVTIIADIADYDSLDATGDEAIVKVGFLAYKQDIAGELTRVNSISDLRETVGEIVSWNPLAFGATLTMNNSGASTYIYSLSDKTGETKTHTDAREALELKDVYSIAVLDGAPGTGDYNTHVDSMSAPENKKERIVILNEEYTYSGVKEDDTAGIRDRNSAYNSRRLFATHPYVAYVNETRSLNTIDPAFIALAFPNNEAGTLEAKFINDTIVGSKTYKAGTAITAIIYDELVAENFGNSVGQVTVLAPVPGYYYAAMVAGQVAGKDPQQPLTNVPTSGLNRTFGSQDTYSEAQLNTMASGGTYIMTQASEQAPIVSRHHVSTNVTSVAKRELSVTTALDYVAKFLRNSLNPYIGRFNITPAFLKLVNSILVSSSLFLSRNGAVEDIRNISVVQDETNPDTLRIEMEVKVKYPVNYIKITLIF